MGGFRTKGPQKSYTQEWLDSMTESLLKWAELEDSCTFIAWLAQENLDYAKVQHMCKKCDTFSKAKKKALFMIGARREQKAIKGEWDSGIVKKSMALYDPEMRNLEIELRGHDMASRAAAIVGVTNYAGMDDIKKQLEALQKENEELKAKLNG
jgi:hypothetical protein